MIWQDGVLIHNHTHTQNILYVQNTRCGENSGSMSIQRTETTLWMRKDERPAEFSGQSKADKIAYVHPGWQILTSKSTETGGILQLPHEQNSRTQGRKLKLAASAKPISGHWVSPNSTLLNTWSYNYVKPLEIFSVAVKFDCLVSEPMNGAWLKEKGKMTYSDLIRCTGSNVLQQMLQLKIVWFTDYKV